MDRLAALLRHFQLSARLFHAGPMCGRQPFDGASGFIHLLRAGTVEVRSAVHDGWRIDTPSVIFYPRPAAHLFVTPADAPVDLVCAAVDLGSAAGNPLAMALPPALHLPLAQVPGLGATLELLFAEAAERHCGWQAAVDRLCELLLIQLLRHLMDAGEASAGLLAGLADARLAKAISAVHERPAAPWSLDAMAAAAGMSRARFAVKFRDTVGMTPGNYLSEWRLGLAQSLLRRGKPVNVVANEVGYANASALSRVFAARKGVPPTTWAKQIIAEENG